MKVLFVDTVHPILSEMLEKKGFDCIHVEEQDNSQFEFQLENIEGLVIRSRFPVNEDFLKKCPKLKFIARSGAGMENIDINYCTNHNIALFNSPEGNRNAVGEHALGMLLSLLNKLHTANTEVKKGLWNRENNRGVELSRKTIGIIGFGNNGEAFAKVLSGFDVQILAYDKYKTVPSIGHIKNSTLAEIQALADVISFHVPQNKETISYFNSDFLRQMQKPFFLLNVSRGKVVESESVVLGLKSGKILGAGLDVLDYENSAFENFLNQNQSETLQYLIQSPHTLLSPHVAGWTIESYYKLSAVLGEKILAEFCS